MAEEVGVAFVRLVPSMRGFGPEAQRALNDGLTGPADGAGAEAGGRFGGAFKTALLGAGVLAGAALIGGVTEALNQGQIVGKLRAQLGATPAEAERYGKIAGQLFSGAIVTDFQQGADTIRAVMSSGLVPPDATNAQIKSIATNAADLANTFDIDLQTAANAAGTMMKNGLAKDGTEAFDLLAAGMTGLGPASEDLMETFTEYGPVFKSAGISGQTAMGMIRQAVKGGWGKDTDKIADAFKEFGLRATEGSKGVTDAFKTLGLNAKQTGDDIAAGGTRGEQAMGKVMDKLRELGPNSQEAKQIVSTLFGGPGEDLGAALFALDIGKASKAMDGAKGSADKLGDGLRDNAGAQITAFKNSMSQAFVEFLGGQVIPALGKFVGFLKEHSGEVKLFATVITAVVVPALVLLGGKAMWAGIQMARAWVIGLGPVGWTIAAIVAAVVLVIAYWDEIVALTKWAWGQVKAGISSAVDGVLAAIGWLARIPGWVGGWFSSMKDKAVEKALGLVGWLRGLPGRIGSALGSLAGVLRGKAVGAFQAFRTAAGQKASDFISWVKGLPGRISRGIGSLTGLLRSKGTDVVRGLWNGIKSMGSWIKDQIMGWAKSMIPGPVAKALGIGSPSKVMAKEVGRWVPEGIAEGWRSNLGSLKSMASATVSTVLPAAAAARMAPAAAGTTVVIDGRNMPRALEEWLRHNVRTRGGGKTDQWLGQREG